MRRILNRVDELTSSHVGPPRGHGSSSTTNYRETPLAFWQLLPARATVRWTCRDLIELVGLVLLAIVLGSAAAVLTAVALRAWIA
jgi:hypothetical protein